MPCAPWQSAQTGASASPLASAAPWTLLLNSSATGEWQMPHVSGSALRYSVDFGLISSCALPWHPPQSGAATPLFAAAPCTLRSQAAASESWQVEQTGLATLAGCGNFSCSL